MRSYRFHCLIALALLSSCSRPQGADFISPPSASAVYDALILGGTIYDGSGGAAYVGDLAIAGDKIMSEKVALRSGRTDQMSGYSATAS